jgi:hypothetical protein
MVKTQDQNLEFSVVYLLAEHLSPGSHQQVHLFRFIPGLGWEIYSRRFDSIDEMLLTSGEACAVPGLWCGLQGNNSGNCFILRRASTHQQFLLGSMILHAKSTSGVVSPKQTLQLLNLVPRVLYEWSW